MMHERKTRAGLGVPSLVLILLVLCLALLGVLSLISARADYRMTFRQAELTAQAAQADADAQRALAKLDERLVQALRASEDEASYTQACEAVAEACGVEIVWQDGEYAVLELDAGEQRTLSVKVRRIEWEKAKQKRFDIEEYALKDRYEWSQTGSLELMGIE